MASDGDERPDETGRSPRRHPAGRDRPALSAWLESVLGRLRTRLGRRGRRGSEARVEPGRTAAEERLRLALRAGRMCTWEWDAATGEVSWSDGPPGVDDPPPFEFRGDLPSFLDLVHPEDRVALRAVLTGALHRGGAITAEFRTVAAGGAVRWWAGNAEAYPSRPGRPGRVLGVTREVTEVRESRERLLRAQSRYRTLVEQLPLASYVENLNEESAAYISPQIADLVGYTAEQWTADPNFFARALHPQDRERVLAGFAAMHESGQALDCEYRLIARDGRVVWIHDAAVVVRDEAGEPQYSQGYMIDISDRRRNEEALRRSQDRLREQMEKAEHQALHDDLTGLPNRTLFQNRIRSALAGSVSFAVLLIDLDRFKEVNDTLGHHSGDSLLQAVGARLQSVLRHGDTVARLGGDEFGVLCLDVSEADAARRVAVKLGAEIARPVALGELTVEIEASLGIALSPAHGGDVETLIRRADVSMYVSKTAHAPIVYIPEYDADSLARLVLVGELRRALAARELTVHYQPQAAIASGEIHKVEALARWRHPERGVISPDEFIPVAEQSGLIRTLTRYVLDTALGQCRAWQEEGRDIAMSVNITGRELLDLSFPDEVAELLARWGIKPTQLELEITENTIMTDPPRARVILGRLRDMGVRLAIDDFGSGHSSLGYLKRWPIDVLKIDKSFVQNMASDIGDAAIVRSAIDLGRSLGLEVVAEGVETEEDRRRLADLGCDTFQGYYLSRPQPGDVLFAELARR